MAVRRALNALRVSEVRQVQDLADRLTTQLTEREAAHQVQTEQAQGLRQQVANLRAERDDARGDAEALRHRLDDAVDEAATLQGRMVVAEQEATRQVRSHTPQMERCGHLLDKPTVFTTC